MIRALLAALAVCALAGCGKKGPPTQPGPQSDIIYPRSYPAPQAAPGAAAAK